MLLFQMDPKIIRQQLLLMDLIPMNNEDKFHEMYSISSFMIFLSTRLSDEEFQKILTLELEYFDQLIKKTVTTVPIVYNMTPI